MNTTEWACFGPQVPECRPVSDEQGNREPSAVNDGPGWVEPDMNCARRSGHRAPPRCRVGGAAARLPALIARRSQFSDHCDGLYVPSVFAGLAPFRFHPRTCQTRLQCGAVTHLGYSGAEQRVQTGQYHDGR